eukprot:s1452_g10.t1
MEFVNWLVTGLQLGHVVGDRGDRVPDSSDDESCQTSGSKRLRAAKAARKAFDNISGEGRVRVSFESDLHQILAEMSRIRGRKSRDRELNLTAEFQ